MLVGVFFFFWLVYSYHGNFKKFLLTANFSNLLNDNYFDKRIRYLI